MNKFWKKILGIKECSCSCSDNMSGKIIIPISKINKEEAEEKIKELKKSYEESIEFDDTEYWLPINTCGCGGNCNCGGNCGDNCNCKKESNENI